MKKKKQALLWKVTGKEIAATSYLFGTMHVRDQRAFEYMDLVKEKINECAIFAAEMDLDTADKLDPSYLMLPKGLTLDQLLKPKTFKRLDKLMQREIGYSLIQFNRQLPIVVSNAIAENTLSTDLPISLDIALWNYAKEQEKILAGVETINEHMSVLPQIPMDYQLRTLKGIADNYGSFKRNLFKMTELYQEGNIQKLYKMTQQSIGGMRKLLLYNRNHIMANKFESLAHEQPILCAVGAAHLAGKEGIIRLLKQKGMRVKPIKLSALVQ